jgi:hypothetical protein
VRGARFVPALGALLVAALIATSVRAQTPNTSRLPAGTKPPAATIDVAAWLAGQYDGTGMGGSVEEQWLPPRAGSMYGTFRLIVGGKTAFSELLTIEPRDDSLVLRVKHFSPQLVGWEEKDKSLDFRFVSATADELRFEALTFRRMPNGGLVIYVAMRRAGETVEEKFELRRLAP